MSEFLKNFSSPEEIAERDRIAEERLETILIGRGGSIASDAIYGCENLLGFFSEIMEIPENGAHNILLKSNAEGRINITYGPTTSQHEIGKKVIRVCFSEAALNTSYES